MLKILKYLAISFIFLNLTSANLYKASILRRNEECKVEDSPQFSSSLGNKLCIGLKKKGDGNAPPTVNVTIKDKTEQLNGTADGSLFIYQKNLNENTKSAETPENSEDSAPKVYLAVPDCENLKKKELVVKTPKISPKDTPQFCRKSKNMTIPITTYSDKEDFNFIIVQKKEASGSKESLKIESESCTFEADKINCLMKTTLPSDVESTTKFTTLYNNKCNSSFEVHNETTFNIIDEVVEIPKIESKNLNATTGQKFSLVFTETSLEKEGKQIAKIVLTPTVGESINLTAGADSNNFIIDDKRINCTVDFSNGNPVQYSVKYENQCGTVIELSDNLTLACTGQKGAINNRCVNCTSLKGYFQLSTENKCNCPEGLLFNNNNPESPECIDPETASSTVNQTNKCDGYCKNGSACTIDENGGPKCACQTGYHGLTCTLRTEEIQKTADNIIEEVFKEPSSPLNLTNSLVVSQIKLFASITTQTSKEENSVKLRDNDLEKITTKTKSTVKDVITKLSKESSSDSEQIPERRNVARVVGMTMDNILYKVNTMKKLRILDSVQDKYINDIKELQRSIHEVNLLSAKKASIETHSADTEETGQITLQYLNSKGIDSYKTWSKKKNIPYINLSSDSLDNNTVLVTTEFSSSLQSAVSDNQYSTGISTSLFSRTTSQGSTLPQITNVEVKIPISSFGGINVELYKYYQARDIDIYNSTHPAFTDPCYINKNFDYDLTQKYRKENLYQKVNIVPTNEKCKYIGYDQSLESAIIRCETLLDSSSYSLTTQTGVSLENASKVYHLPFKCPSDIASIETNIAFWLFLVLFLSIIAINILLLITSTSSSGKEYEDKKQNQVVTVDYTKEITTKDIEIRTEPDRNGSFLNILLSNFLQMHLLLVPLDDSLTHPKFLSGSILVFNIFSLFGFNGIYFNEKYIEERIYNSNRSSFVYSMRKEFPIIISSIATTVLLNIIIRLVCLVTANQKNILSEKLKTTYKEENKEYIIKDFEHQMLPRRVIALTFMFLSGIFLFYYSVVFCGVYTKTQIGWFYSGIWCLILDWFAFSPFYIIIVSLIEAFGNENCAHYFKEINLF